MPKAATADLVHLSCVPEVLAVNTSGSRTCLGANDAAVAQLDEWQAILGQCFLEFTSVTACSTITLPAGAAMDHVARFGRNLDYAARGLIDKPSVALVYRPHGR